MTKFEQAVMQAEAGTLQLPSVQYGNNPIDYFFYQLSVHQFHLRLASKGIKSRGFKLADLKAYYGLKGRTAADCLPQMDALIEKFKARSVAN